MPTRAPSVLRLLALAAVLLALAPGRAPAQNLYVANPTGSTVGEYDATTGATVSKPFVTSGLSSPYGLALANNNLYAANFVGGNVTAYNATTGAAAGGFTTINTGDRSGPWDVLAAPGMLYVSTYFTGTVAAYDPATGSTATGFTTISLPNDSLAGLALSGTTLYVADHTAGTIRTYDARTGALLNANFLTGLRNVLFLTVAGTTLYASDQSADTVRAFNAATGAAVPGFTTITGLNTPNGVKVFGNDLLVAIGNSNKISEYDATTGALISANFITGLSNPYGIAVVPEPSTEALFIVGTAALALAARRRRVRAA